MGWDVVVVEERLGLHHLIECDVDDVLVATLIEIAFVRFEKMMCHFFAFGLRWMQNQKKLL